MYIYTAVTAAKPAVKVSAAVFADKQLARDYFSEDWPVWLSSGKVDAVIPMAYDPDNDDFAKLVDGALASAAGRHVYVGQGAYKVSADQTVQQLESVRSKGAPGFVLFDYTALVAGTLGSRRIDRVATLQSQPATTPPMPWKN